MTREQLQETERNLNRRIDEVRSELVEVRTEIAEVRAELKQDITGVRGEVKEVRSKLDRMQWAICGTIIVGAVTLLFKEQILMALLS
ncbi:hypothetical protein [Vibrio jasicida]|uniref:hypothetical protein n=1 Tax=Vibrio jasicida TaxID=766224 RepID=UPI0011B03D04|nr:hypothetical protein [Vibrio jasicida]